MDCLNEIVYLGWAVVVYSGFAATLFLILTKYKIIQYIQANGRFGLNKIANCHLCICFWLNLFIALIGVIFGMDMITMLAPFAGASITRAILG